MSPDPKRSSRLLGSLYDYEGLLTLTSLLRRCYCTTVFRLAGQSALGLATPYSPAGESTTATYVTTLSRAADEDASTGAALLVGA
mmetsp:Transcript_9575/g.37346  ORF Transcript_9575/g.37346 Transcript_9575/m.37346 type:complete len:85 (-) Transcript_9575:771-1025(-)